MLTVAHGLDLLLQLWPVQLELLNQLLSLVKRSFCQSPLRRRLFKVFMEERDVSPVLPVHPVQTRWGTWIEAAAYQSSYLLTLHEFFQSDIVDSTSATVEKLRELTSAHLNRLRAEATFARCHGGKLVSAVKVLQTRTAPLAHKVYGIIEDLKSTLEFGSRSDDVDFGEAVFDTLEMLPSEVRANCVSTFQAVYTRSSAKLVAIWENHPCRKLYGLIRIFDPKQLPTLSVHQPDYGDLKGIREVPGSEWHQYTSLKSSDLPETLNLDEWWKAQKERFPTLTKAALPHIWLPVASAEVERSFSQYSDVLRDDRQSLSEESLRSLFTLKWNGPL